MKQFRLTALFFLLGTFALNAQSSNGNTIPEGLSRGTVVTTDNSIMEGYVKNNMKKNGEILFFSADGKKTRFSASQLFEATVDSTRYIVSNNAFYKVVKEGVKIKLLRKASNSSGIGYNGTEPIVVNSGEGVYNDYFIQTVATKKMELVRKKDFQQLFVTLCADCPTLTEDIKSNKIGFTDIEQAVAFYNSCEK